MYLQPRCLDFRFQLLSDWENLPVCLKYDYLQYVSPADVSFDHCWGLWQSGQFQSFGFLLLWDPTNPSGDWSKPITEGNMHLGFGWVYPVMSLGTVATWHALFFEPTERRYCDISFLPPSWLRLARAWGCTRIDLVRGLQGERRNNCAKEVWRFVARVYGGDLVPDLDSERFCPATGHRLPYYNCVVPADVFNLYTAFHRADIDGLNRLGFGTQCLCWGWNFPNCPPSADDPLAQIA
jgi:hypothetical protein